MQQINILFLTHSLDIGGTENHLLHLISNLDKEKFKSIVCCLYNLGFIGEKLIDNQSDIKVYHTLIKNKWDIRGFWKLMYIFKKENIHILYIVHSPITLFYGIISAKFSNVNICITRMTATNPTYHVKRRKIINIMALPFLNKIVAQAYFHKEYLVNYEGFKSEKIIVIYNGVDLTLFDEDKDIDRKVIKESLGISKHAPIIGVVARLAPEKGHDVLLRAAKRVISKFPDVHFIIVGDGPERKTLENLTYELAIQSNVHFLGIRRDIPKLITLFDICVLPSRPQVETFSNSILEYMAACKPVVATNVGSTAEQVIDGKTGFLVPPEDHEALADKIIKLLHNPDLIKKMGNAGRKLIEEKFTIQKMIERYEILFEDLIK